MLLKSVFRIWFSYAAADYSIIEFVTYVYHDYLFQPSVEIVCLWRSETSLSDYGCNQLARWKPDSSRLAVTVSFIKYCNFTSVRLDCFCL